MPVRDDTFATRRHLPHLQRPNRLYFVTFTTIAREVLSPHSRDIALACCVYGHGRQYWLETVVVMPDHVPLLLAPHEQFTLPRVLKTLKGVSARLINLAAKRRGSIWQDESFDRIVRAGEDVREKSRYICENPVRARLVASPDEYRWMWRQWVEGQIDQSAILAVLPDWIRQRG
jgi:REP element-mobilizing transposase RayT